MAWKPPKHPNGVSGGKKTSTTITKKDGSQTSGYISNGSTYYSDGTKLGTGDSVYDSSGKQWTMGSDGKGSLTGYAEGSRPVNSNSAASGKYNREYGYTGGGSNNYYNSALEKQLKAQQDAINQQKQAAISGINTDYEAQQRANYIANARGQNQAGDMLNSMGYSGGMAESTLASMNNDYQNNRYAADQNRNTAIQQAESTGSAQMASAQESYYNKLQSAIQQQKQEEYQREQQAKEDYSSMIGAYSNDYMAEMNKLRAAGVSEDDYRYKLLNAARNEKIANQQSAQSVAEQQAFENQIAWQKLLNANAQTDYNVNKPYYRSSSGGNKTSLSNAFRLRDELYWTDDQLNAFLRSQGY